MTDDAARPRRDCPRAHLPDRFRGLHARRAGGLARAGAVVLQDLASGADSPHMAGAGVGSTLLKDLLAAGTGLPGTWKDRSGWQTQVAIPAVLEEATCEDGPICARKGDRHGNLVFRRSAQDVSPPAPIAGTVTIVEVEVQVEPDRDEIHLQGVFVHRVLPLITVALRQAGQEADTPARLSRRWLGQSPPVTPPGRSSCPCSRLPRTAPPRSWGSAPCQSPDGESCNGSSPTSLASTSTRGLVLRELQSFTADLS